eukprot:TRINITY_DN944_c1_g1_i1.p2 TRINITY_DN944_c1_g1~~TRINITY_DN944_c1_g1_i1.p2  ORF type:complete len:160 (+),score=7.36 TRINITY_DN944_c1_g1_i1:147-626(+)
MAASTAFCADADRLLPAPPCGRPPRLPRRAPPTPPARRPRRTRDPDAADRLPTDERDDVGDGVTSANADDVDRPTVRVVRSTSRTAADRDVPSNVVTVDEADLDVDARRRTRRAGSTRTTRERRRRRKGVLGATSDPEVRDDVTAKRTVWTDGGRGGTR